MSNEQWWQEIELLGQLRELEVQRQEAQQEFEELTAERKRAKQEVDRCMQQILQVSARLVQVSQGKDFPAPAAIDEPARSEPNNTPLADPASTQWRSTPTDQLLNGSVKGLGAKKAEAIIELAPTAGDLEDLRGEASRAFKSFREMLPKGCGQAIADQVEELLLQHIAKQSIPPASEQVKENSPLSKPAETPADLDLERIESEYEVIREELVEQEIPASRCTRDAMATKEHREGWDAADRGEAVRECPYTAITESSQCDRWLEGYAMHGVLDDQPGEVEPQQSAELQPTGPLERQPDEFDSL